MCLVTVRTGGAPINSSDTRVSRMIWRGSTPLMQLDVSRAPGRLAAEIRCSRAAGCVTRGPRPPAFSGPTSPDGLDERLRPRRRPRYTSAHQIPLLLELADQCRHLRGGELDDLVDRGLLTRVGVRRPLNRRHRARPKSAASLPAPPATAAYTAPSTPTAQRPTSRARSCGFQAYLGWTPSRGQSTRAAGDRSATSPRGSRRAVPPSSMRGSSPERPVSGRRQLALRA